MPDITPLIGLSAEALASSINNQSPLEHPQPRSEIFRRAGGPCLKLDALYIGTFSCVAAAVLFTACALVTSLELSSFGVNFHRACNHGIIVERPQNLAVACGLIPKPPASVPRSRLLAAFGESTRRPNEVHWWVLHQRDSYDAFLDARNLEKYAGTLAAEGNINDAITGEYRIICAYEILRVYLGQESNRYPRLRVVWYKMDTEKVRRQGFFYTALARFLFRNPDLQNLITPNTIGQIASRWELGSELTIAHVEPDHPSAPPELDADHIGRVTLSIGRVTLSTAKEREEAYRENMAAHWENNDRPNDDVFGVSNAFQDEPDEEEGFGGPGPLKKVFDLSLYHPSGGEEESEQSHSGTEDKDVEMMGEEPGESSTGWAKRKRAGTKGLARDVQIAKRNKL
ncbi:hypothetical protein ACLX1H_007664 [Fusarium chlamydosporum]